MPKRTIKFRNLSSGLYIGEDAIDQPRPVMRRNRGVHPVCQNIFETRPGSTLLHDLTSGEIHGLAYFYDFWTLFRVASGTGRLYAGASWMSVPTFGVTRPSFTRMAPTAGNRDCLFIAGARYDDNTQALYKLYPYFSLVNDLYQWTASGFGTSEYYCEADGGGNPGLNRPDALLLEGSAAEKGVGGSLPAGSWWWGDNDALGYSTVYVRLSNGSDPDTLSAGEVEAIYLWKWGIDVPDDTILAADGGAGGELTDGGVYRYRAAFYNSNTGHRGNPTVSPAADVYTKLLLHCEGADESTDFTDSSGSAHADTAVADAQIDTAQYKFGAASGLFDGTGDYVSFPDHADWVFGTNPFTIDFWFRAAVWTDPTTHGICGQYQDGTYYWDLKIFTVGGNDYIYFHSYDVAISANFTSVGIAANEWHHYALIRGWNGNPEEFAFTVDGNLVDVSIDGVSSSLLDLAAVLTVGASPTGAGITQFTNGWIDEFRISKGIARWTSNFTPPTAPYGAAEVDLAGGSTSVDLTGIPVSTDSQVSHVELWRTIGDGTVYFFLARLVNGTTTYTDNISDNDLGSTELPIDNNVPYNWFDDSFGPYNSSMFWISRTQAGQRGRVYYSAIGRAEAMQGYIEVCGDDLGLQKGLVWQGTIFVVGEDGWYQIAGTNPYFSRKIEGAPGTTAPYTVAIAPWGILYQASDGIRVFNGTTSSLITTPKDIQRLFWGKSGGALSSFTGVVAAYGRGEYFISDGTQLIAFNGERWRDVGDLDVTGISYAKDADIIGIGTDSSEVYSLEAVGTTEDGTDYIERDIETDKVRIASDGTSEVLHVHIDYAKESLT